MVYGKLVYRFLLYYSIINCATCLFLAKNGNLIKDAQALELVDELNHLKVYPPINKKNKTDVKIQEKNDKAKTPKIVESKNLFKKNVNRSDPQDVRKTVTEKVEIFPPENVANYLFQTNDLRGVEEEIERLIKSNQMTKNEALNYISKIETFWKKYDERAVENLVEAEREKAAENGLLTDMLNIGQEMNKNAQLEKLLYDYVQRLYDGGSFSGKNDDHAGRVLKKFMAELQNEVRNGQMDPYVQDQIFDILSRAITDFEAKYDSASRMDKS